MRILVSHHHTALVSVQVMEMDLCWSVESNPRKPVYFIQLDDTSRIVGQRGHLKSVLRRWESDTGAAGSLAEQTRLQDVLLPTFLLVPAARSCPLGCLTASFQCREMEKTKAVGKSECFFAGLACCSDSEAGLESWIQCRGGSGTVAASGYDG